MVRDLRRLADTCFDALVIGAGVYGAAAAWDAAQRGLSVALIDRGDVGGGTSFNNLKTLHGGLRSLQSLDFAQMRRFIRERRALARIVPHLVRPLPFVVPTTNRLLRSRLAMRVALAVNDVVSHDRHDGIADPALRLPDGRVVTRDEALRANPVVSADGVTGGAVWFDYQMTNADRVTFAFARSAAAAGAIAANHVEADGFLIDEGRVIGARVRDRLSDAAFDVRARVVVNATGAWAPDLVRTLPGGAAAVPAHRLSRAMNLVLDRSFGDHACGGVVDGRFLFLVPWRDISILGTSHDVHEGSPDELAVTRADLEGFLRDGREAFPGADLAWDRVRLVHRGLLPMVSGRGKEVSLLRESAVVNHAAHGAPALVSMHGVRYTTARHTAEQAVDLVFDVLGHQRAPACRTSLTPLAGGDIPDVTAFVRGVRTTPGAVLPPAALARLARTYGTECDRVLQAATEEPALVAPLGARCEVTGAEIVYAARHEMAMSLGDALIRRTEAGSAGHPGSDALARAAALMAAEHGWTDRRRQDEIAAVDAFYQLPE
ncbi:MAG: FAD-dependent oxidoreductase [Acidobacteriota bacterium]|nr:FAD-dependent oxidoreductase [Acidobacteriota bacterium]